MVMQQTEMSDAVGVSCTINYKAYADLHPEQKKYIFCHLHLGVAAPILRCLRMYASSLNSVRHVALFYVTIYGRQTLTETINLSYHAQLISRFLSDDCQVFSSPELKAQVSFSDHLSSVCLSVCLSVRPSVNFSHFHLLLQNHWANFNQTWHKASLGEGDSSLFK